MEKITKSSDKVLIDPNEPLILPDGTALVGRLEWFLYALCCLDYQNLPTPMSRIEEFANALITGEVPNIEPQSRAEQFFLAILDGNVSDLPQPQSRSEVLLDKLARGEFDLSDVEPIQSRYELLLAYLIKNGGIGNIDYVLYEFSEAMKTMYNTVEKPFKSLELNGNTLVNCVLEDTGNDDYTSFDEDYSETSFTINGTSEGAIKSATLKGQTLVNLVPKKIIDHIASSDWDGYCCLVQNSKQSFDQWRTLQDLKPNTKYYISCYVETFEDANNKDYCLNNPSVESIFGDSMLVNGVGRYQWLSTTKSELTDEIFIVLRSQNALARGAIKIRDIMIIEYQQGMENWDIPYFEGMQSVQMPVLTTTGKNLFNEELRCHTGEHVNVNKLEEGEYSIQTEQTNQWESQNVYVPIKLKQNEKICVYGAIKNIINTRIYKNNFNTEVAYFNPSSVPTEYASFNLSYVANEDCTVLVRFWLNGMNSIGYIKNLMIEVGEKTSYEPYKSNILTTTSKNLFDMNRPCDVITDSQATVVQSTNQITVSSADSGTYVSANFILDKDFFAGKTVTGSCLYESDEKDIGTVQIYYQDGNGEHHYQWIRTPRTFTFPNSFIGDVTLSVCVNNTGTPQSNTVTVKNIQLELGSTATSYESYSEGVTLRGIGDVKDELNLLTGEVTQNIYQITLTGDESGYGYSTAPSVDTDFHGTLNIRSANLPLNKKLVAPISNRFQGALYGANKTWQCCIGGSYALHFFIPKTELETSDINGFKNWVKQQYLNGNPIKVAYILEEKSIKTVDLNVVDQNNIKIDKIHVFDGTTHVNASSDELTPTVNIGKSVSYPTIIKPNTKYTVDLKRNDKSLTVNLGGTEVTFASGETRKTITTPSTLTNDKLSYYGVGAKCNEIMLIEGEIEGNVDYFTGMQSVVMQNQMPILSTVGKNLIHVSKGYVPTAENEGITISRDEINQTITLNGTSTIDNNCFALAPIDNLEILKGETYTITAYLISGVASGNYSFRLNDKGWSNAISTIIGGRLSNTKTYVKDALYTESSVRIDTGATFENAVFKVQFEKNTASTSHEPYKSSILSCNNDVTLRGIGDVQDILDLMTGEVVERVGEVIFDGSVDENWNLWATYPEESAIFRLSKENSLKLMKEFDKNGVFKCDKFSTVLKSSLINDGVRNPHAISFFGSDNEYIQLRVYKSLLKSIDVTGLREYLINEPITVQYTLATESIKTVDSNVVDQDGNIIPKIKSYDGVTHFEVTVPKQSLLPNISAEVATDNSKDMSSLTIKHQEISEAQSAIQDNIQSQSDEIDTALMATTEIFESILE